MEREPHSGPRYFKFYSFLETWHHQAGHQLWKIALFGLKDCSFMKRMSHLGRAAGCLIAGFMTLQSHADETSLTLYRQDTNTLLQVRGEEGHEWRFQGSANLTVWTNQPRLGTAYLNNVTNAEVSLGTPSDAVLFYRAVKTTGFYDTNVLRTISLTFTQANWQTLLANGRTTGIDIPGTLVMNNAVTNYGVGARYKGNTSYTGMGGAAPTKKSLNINLDYTNSEARLMGYSTLNLNNAYTDETIMREALYFDTMRQYTVCPKGAMARLYINGTYWGVYSSAQQPNNDLIKEYFPSTDGDRWRAPNMGTGTGGGGPGGGGMGGSGSAFSYLGTNAASYTNNYELKSDYNTNAWPRLVHATYVLNNTGATLFRDAVENVIAVDRWLWFLALENIFTDEDSYYYKGADYCFYYEPESGRFHPVEYDGNESFISSDYTLSPVQGATDNSRPLLYKLLSNAELRQRYLAHMRTVLEESYRPDIMTPAINHFAALSMADIANDTKKGYTMQAYTNDLVALKTFVTNRYKFLTNYSELRPLAPVITSVSTPNPIPTALETPTITAQVQTNGAATGSVWLYYRPKTYGRFTVVQMFDDGAHNDGEAGDGVYGASTTNYPAGTKVHYYVEARSANATKTASFSPARAEQETYKYKVAIALTNETPVVINELMASNSKTCADPQGQYDDWIELHNITDADVDLTGRYLSDEPFNPRKWAFPDGTIIPAQGYLLIWADEDTADTPGLHASFKLSASGEQLFLIDTDANNNLALDAVSFGAQETDRSYGRLPSDTNTFGIMSPTPGQPNQ